MFHPRFLGKSWNSFKKSCRADLNGSIQAEPNIFRNLISISSFDSQLCKEPISKIKWLSAFIALKTLKIKNSNSLIVFRSFRPRFLGKVSFESWKLVAQEKMFKMEMRSDENHKAELMQKVNTISIKLLKTFWKCWYWLRKRWYRI